MADLLETGKNETSNEKIIMVRVVMHTGDWQTMQTQSRLHPNIVYFES